MEDEVELDLIDFIDTFSGVCWTTGDLTLGDLILSLQTEGDITITAGEAGADMTGAGVMGAGVGVFA